MADRALPPIGGALRPAPLRGRAGPASQRPAPRVWNTRLLVLPLGFCWSPHHITPATTMMSPSFPRQENLPVRKRHPAFGAKGRVSRPYLSLWLTRPRRPAFGRGCASLLPSSLFCPACLPLREGVWPPCGPPGPASPVCLLQCLPPSANGPAHPSIRPRETRLGHIPGRESDCSGVKETGAEALLGRQASYRRTPACVINGCRVDAIA